MFFGERKKIYTDRQLKFLEALRDEANKGDIRKCMDVAGYVRTASMAEVIKALKKEIIDIAEELLAGAAPKAALKLSGSLDEGPLEPGIKEKLSSANSILDRVGVAKTERIEVDNAPSRIMILPARRQSSDE